MKTLKSSLILFSIASVLFSQKVIAGDVIVVNMDNREKPLLVRKCSQSSRHFIDLPFNEECFIPGVKFENMDGIKIRGKKWNGGDSIVFANNNFRDVIIFITHSQGHGRGGEIEAKIKEVDSGDIEKLSEFIDVVKLMKKIASLSDMEIASFKKFDLEQNQKKILEGKKFYKNNYKLISSYFENLYDGFFENLKNIENKFSNTYGEMRLNPLHITQLAIGQKVIPKNNKINCIKIIDTVVKAYNENEVPELGIICLLENKNIDDLKEIGVIANSIINKDRYKKSKNIIENIILICDFLVQTCGENGLNQDIKNVELCLIKTINKVIGSTYIKLKTELSLEDQEISGLDLQSLNTARKAIEEFNKFFDLANKKYDFFKVLYKDFKETIDQLLVKVNIAISEARLENFSDIIMVKELKVECLDKIERFMSSYRKDSKSLQANLWPESETSLCAIKVIAQKMIEVIDKKDLENKKPILNEIVNSIDNIKKTVKNKKSYYDQDNSRAKSFINNY